MPRIRTIKPEFWTSETVASLPIRARLTFAGVLTTYVDDSGRGRDNVKLVQAAVYPLDEDLAASEIQEDLAAIEAVSLICRYEVDGKRYFYVPGWHEHQYISKPTPSKLPDPPGAGKTETPEFSPESPGEFEESPVGSGSGSGSGEKTSSPQAASDSQPPLLTIVKPDPLSRFPEFYAAYPRRRDRRDAERAWIAAIKRKVDPQRMIDAAASFAKVEKDKKTKAEYIKLPATWLNKGCYDNELEVSDTFTDGAGNLIRRSSSLGSYGG